MTTGRISTIGKRVFCGKNKLKSSGRRWILLMDSSIIFVEWAGSSVGAKVVVEMGLSKGVGLKGNS